MGLRESSAMTSTTRWWLITRAIPRKFTSHKQYSDNFLLIGFKLRKSPSEKNSMLAPGINGPNCPNSLELLFIFDQTGPQNGLRRTVLSWPVSFRESLMRDLKKVSAYLYLTFTFLEMENRNRNIFYFFLFHLCFGELDFTYHDYDAGKFSIYRGSINVTSQKFENL